MFDFKLAQYADTVVLVKVAAGGRSLRVDFRPPSAGGATGPLYTQMVAEMNAVMAGLTASGVAGLAGVPAVLEGLVWWQGWSDLDQPDGYADLLQFLISDVRSALGEASLPVVVAATGNGYDAGNARARLESEQRLGAQDGCPHSSGDSTPFEMRFPPLTKRSTQLVQRQ